MLTSATRQVGLQVIRSFQTSIARQSGRDPGGIALQVDKFFNFTLS